MKNNNCLTFLGKNRVICLVRIEMKKMSKKKLISENFSDMCCDTACDDFGTLMNGEKTLTLCNLKGRGKFAY